MSAKMKRRRRHDRRKRILTERREISLFFGRRVFPASARACATCPCGSMAFSRDPHDNLSDFMEAHAYCEEMIEW